MTSTEGQLIGHILDARNVRATIPNDALVTDAIVITRIANPHGGTHLNVAWSEGMDWITRRGLIEVALDGERLTPDEREDP